MVIQFRNYGDLRHSDTDRNFGRTKLVAYGGSLRVDQHIPNFSDKI